MTLSEELERLHRLHECGALTDEEFATAKARLLKSSADLKPPPLVFPRLRDRLQSGRFWAMLLHLSLLLNFLMPGVALIITFLIWQIGKDRFAELDEHGKNVINFVLSYGIYALILFLLFIIPVVSIPVIGAAIVMPMFYLFMAIVALLALFAAWKANQGQVWRYPLCFRFFE